MLSLKCVKCGAEMTPDNDAAQTKIACECGCVYTLPPAPPKGDFRVCGACGRLCEAKTIVCPECEMNFRLNRKSAVVNQEATWYESHKSMVVKLITCAVLILLGSLIYFGLIREPGFGVAPASPLGKFDSKSGKFCGLLFEKSSKTPRKSLKDCSVWEYSPANDPAKKKTLLAGEQVFLAVSPDGAVKAMSGACTEFDTVAAVAGTPVGRFYLKFRTGIGIPESAAPKEEVRGKDRFMQIYEVFDEKNEKFVLHQEKAVSSIPLLKGMMSFQASVSGTEAEDMFSPLFADDDYEDFKPGSDDDAEPF